MNSSLTNTTIIHIDTGNGGIGDHFMTIIRNPETGDWETVDHTSGDKKRRGSNPFDPNSNDNLLSQIRRITYVE